MSDLDLYGPEHIRRYLETDGEVGYLHSERRATILLLTTVGRVSGLDRTTALIFQEWDGDYLVVASNGGAAEPNWFRNLLAAPAVRVQVRADRFAARARVATAQERPAMWARMTDVWPKYETYQARADREIPVVVLRPDTGGEGDERP